MRVARLLVAAALRTLPAPFRRRFGEAMADTVDAGLSARRGLTRLAFLVRSLAGIVLVGIRERISPTPHPAERPSHSGRAPLMDSVLQEFRFAVRALRRRPAFTFVAVLTLALGIGSTTAVFSVVNGVLLRPLPYPEADRVMAVSTYQTPDGPGERRWNMSQPDLESVRASASFAAVEGWSSSTMTLTGDGDPRLVVGTRVTGGLLHVFGLSPHLGRDLEHDENMPGAAPTVVVSHAFWRTQLGGSPDVLGSTLEIAEESYEIVGVAPAGFDYPREAELWIPRRLDTEGCGRGCHTFQTVARLAEGVGFEQARQELSALAASLADAFPDSNFQKGMRVERLVDYLVGDVRRGLWMLLGAVGVVLLIACVNVANLLLVRGSSRTSEVAVRSALGAGPTRVVGAVLVESAVLAGAGALLGLLVAWGAVGALDLVPPGAVPRLDAVSLDGTVLLFASSVTVAVTLLFGLWPALRLARTAPAGDLGGAARSGGNRTDARSRSTLLAAEVALSVVLLAGAGLFVRSLSELTTVDLGFQEREIVRFSLSLPSARYDELPEIAGHYQELEARLLALPEVEAVGSTYDAPLGFVSISGEVRVQGRPIPGPGEGNEAYLRPSTPGFFEAIGLPVLRGRGIEPSDRAESEAVVVVNEEFVRQNFPDEEVLGQRIGVTAGWRYQRDSLYTVVGVVPDTRSRLSDPPVPAVYLPHAQFGPGNLTVHMRGRTGATGLIERAREEVRALDPGLPLARVETLGEAVRRGTATTRFYLSIVAIFAGLAVVMAAVGLYGVVSYLVSRRTREIGIRVALGAGTERVRRMVVMEGLRPALAGLVLGIGGALLAGRVLDGLLFQVQPGDPSVLGAVALILLAVATVATIVPAARATRVDPVTALRAD